MNLTTRSLAVEVNKFFRSIIKEDNIFTKQSYSKAREKLNHGAYLELNSTLVDKYYSDDDYKSYKGLRLIAIDGSKYRLPDTLELKNVFGLAKNSTKEHAMALGVTAFDLLNGICISSKLDKYSENEISLAQQLIENIKAASNSSDLFIMDRLYPSLYFLCKLTFLLNSNYLIRCTAESFLKEVREFAINENLNDSIITINLQEKYKSKDHKNLEEFLKLGLTELSFRVVKVKLKDGKTEYLITSLKQEMFSKGELKHLYGLRWTEELYFNFQKNILEIENFSGKKPENIRQDYYCKILVSNIEELIITEAEDEIDKQVEGSNDYKYEKYKVNRSVLTGMLKDEIAEMLFTDDEEKSQKHFDYLVEIAKKNKVAVIPNRQFPRSKKIIHPSHLYRRKAL